MEQRSFIVMLVVSTSLVAVSAAFAAEDDKEANAEAEPVVVDYRGKLQNADGRPISGVFHLEFNIYGSEESAEPDWTERQFVAVTDGSYQVPLGRRTDLLREEIDSSPWIGIELVGEGEILRDRLNLRQRRRAANRKSNPDAIPEEPTPSKARKMLEKAKNSDQMAFADVAERAVTADIAKRANRAEKLGSMSADKVERLSNLALERLGEHIADPNAHSAAGKKLEDTRRVLKNVGGGGGNRYERECPPGYVVTGIKGGAGRVVDSISIICQPLK